MCRKLSYQVVIITLLGFTMTTVSCREDSDDIKSYAYEDSLIYLEANSSLEGQFKAIWTAMNCNYPMWDYEEQQGLNWDRVYDEFLLCFKELDREYNSQNPVPDSLVSKLYEKIFAPLHDGHLSMDLKNLHTGKRIYICPQLTRNMDSIDFNLFFNPTLNYYNDEGELAKYIQEESYIFAQFKDGIVYFRLPEFHLTETFQKRNPNESNDRIYKLWESWFNCVQNLQSTDSLKGLIIDLRNNNGGNANDYQYVLGALHNGNSDEGRTHKVGYLRNKFGIGRFDFCQPHPFNLPIYGKEHVTVETPIVILVNGCSKSMAEITTLSAKQLKNGYVIGTRTYGAYSPLITFDDRTTDFYAGSVGDPSLDFAPFYIDIPTVTFLSVDKLFLDGAGVEPDEVVHLDYLEHSKNGKDNQLDRALEYIRTKKY